MTKNQKILISGIGLLIIARYFLGQSDAEKNAVEYVDDMGAAIMEYVKTFSENAMRFVTDAEGFSATPYRDAGGWSIGYGHYMGTTPSLQYVDEMGALRLLESDMTSAQNAVNSRVHVQLTQNQFDALTSLAYNIGAGNFGGSTLVQLLNAGDYAGAADQFGVWNKARIDGTLVVVPALVARRASERDLFLSA